MIRVKIYAPPWCDDSRLDDKSWVELSEGSTLADAVRLIRMPTLLAKVFHASINGEAKPLNTVLRDGDVIGFFSLITGG